MDAGILPVPNCMALVKSPASVVLKGHVPAVSDPGWEGGIKGGNFLMAVLSTRRKRVGIIIQRENLKGKRKVLGYTPKIIPEPFC